jgi:hypothetical protein
MTAIAVLVPLLWLGWLALIDWVPLFPLNDLRPDNRRERRVAALANYPVPVLIAAGVALDRGWTLLVALALCGLCLAGHVVNWWLPYFGPGTAGQRATYAREYARTWKVLPTAGHAVVIDVQHMVVGGLTLAMLGTTLAATLTG